MEIEAIGKLAAPIFTALLIFLIKRVLEYRQKLLTYLVHASAIPLKDEPGTIVNTHSLVVRNTGKKTAHNVRVGHDILPKSYQIYPQLTHEIIEGNGDSAEIVIPTLVPNEQVNISYLYFPPTIFSQINSYCKSDEVQAKTINIIPSPHLGKVTLFTIWSLIFLGATTVVYGMFLSVWWYISNA